MAFKLEPLRVELRVRDPSLFALPPRRASDTMRHPLFEIVPGPDGILGAPPTRLRFHAQSAMLMHMTATQSDPESLERLLAASAEGDQRAFAELYRRTSAKLFGVCLRMLRERSEAEDVLQDVYASAWRRAGSFDATRATAMTWLITLARNRAIDRLRQHRAVELDDAALLELTDDAPTPALHAESNQERRRLEHCLDELEAKQKSAVRAAFFTGATYNELAERCRVPLATMKSWIRRSLIRLRSCLER